MLSALVSCASLCFSLSVGETAPPHGGCKESGTSERRGSVEIGSWRLKEE